MIHFKQMEKIKMSGQCAVCLGYKTEHFYYTYGSFGDTSKMLVCGKCAGKKSAEIDKIIKESASVFSAEDVLIVLKESVAELKKEISARQNKAFGIKDILVFDIYNNLIIKPLQEELRSKELKIRMLSMTDEDKKKIVSFDLNYIKQIKPQVLLGKEESSAGRTLKYKCPIHQEKTASFVWYKNNNRFYCFGCGESGSIIDLFMKLNKCDFKVACNELQKYI
jgi:hypothetical protein